MDELLKRHGPAVGRLARRMLADSADAEDVLQEAYVRAFQALPSFQGKAAFSTWLYRIVVNACLMHRRKRAPCVVSLDGDEDAGDARARIEGLAHLRPVTPLDLLIRGEQRAMIRTAVRDLPESLRLPFVLSELSDVSVRDAARSLNVGVGAYRTRLCRARSRVRASLRAFEPDAPGAAGRGAPGSPRRDVRNVPAGGGEDALVKSA